MRKAARSALGLMACILLAGAAAFTGAATGDNQFPLAPAYSCNTTYANEVAGGAQTLHETDVVQRFGKWYHGIARPDSRNLEPFYDYYVGKVGTPPVWTFINISPQNTFVATAPSLGSEWRILFPAGEGTWRVSVDYAGPLAGKNVQWMRIMHPDLTQECDATVVPSATPAWSVVPSRGFSGEWTCFAALTGKPSIEERLSVSQMYFATPAPAPATPGVQSAAPEPQPTTQNWWQGHATTTPAPDVTPTPIYDFDLYYTKDQRVMVEVDAAGSYSIATSSLKISPLIFPTTWTVIYPEVGNGYTFEYAPPDGFRIVFADGSQVCHR